MSDNEIKRPGADNPLDAPQDAVSLDVECMRTRFTGKGRKRRIKDQKKVPGNIKASVRLGVVSITDRYNDTMATVRIEDMAAVMAAAYEMAKGEEAAQCQTEISEPAGNVAGE